MNPWNWFINQDIHMPLSGSVAQRIEPRLELMRQLVPGLAGHADQEAAITRHVSYGRQIGWLIEAVIALSEQNAKAGAAPVAAVEHLKKLNALLTDLKALAVADPAHSDANEHADLVLAVRVAKLKGGDAYDKLAEELRAVLG